MANALQILAARAAARQSEQAAPEIDPNTDPVDLLKQVGGYGLGAVAAAGNLLDLPGSIVRDFAVGKGWSSFDQILTPFSEENRTTGREVLTKFGFTRKNKEGGVGDWWGDPSEGAADVAGFMAEFFMDPFGPLGKLAKVPSMLGKAGSVAGQIAGTTFRALPLARRVENAVAPKAGWALRQMKALFDAPSLNTTTADAQRYMRDYHRYAVKSEDRAHAMGVMAIKTMDDLGFTTDTLTEEGGKNLDAITRYVERAEDPEFIIDANPAKVPDQLKPILDGLILEKDRIHAQMKNYYHAGDFYDPAGIEEFPRYMNDLFRHELIQDGVEIQTKATRRFAESEAAALNARDLVLQGMRGGTANWDAVLRDPEWNDTILKVRQDPDLLRREDTLQFQYAGVVGPRHLEPFADSVEMSTKQLWQELGFDRMKPYALIEDVEKALDGFRLKQADLAKQGKGVFRQQTGFGNAYYDNILTGEGTQVRMVNGVPVLPDGQLVNQLDDVSDEDLFAWLKQKANRDPEAMDRILEAERNGTRPVTWDDADGNQVFVLPRLRANLEQQWSRRISGLRNRMENSPLQNKEVSRDIIREKLEEKYGKYIIKEMPAVNKDGTFSFTVDPTYKNQGLIPDPKGNLNPDGSAKLIKDPLKPGKTLRMTRKQSLEFMSDYKDQLAEGIVKMASDDRYDALADLITNHERVRRLRMFNRNPIISHIDYMSSNARMVGIGEATIKWLSDSFVENSGQSIDKFSVQKRSMAALHYGEIADGMTVDDFFKAHPHFDRGVITGWVAQTMRDRPEVKFLFEGDFLKGKTYTKTFEEAFNATRPDPKVWEDLNKVFATFRTLPEVSDLMKYADSALTVQKANLLATPSGVFRDVVSSLFQMWTMKDFDHWNPKHYGRMADAKALLSGKLPDTIPMTPAVQNMLQSLNMKDTPVNRANALLSLFTGAIHRARLHELGGDSLTVAASGTGESLMKAMPGYKHRGIFKSIADRFNSQSLWQNINPINVQGVVKREIPDIDMKVAGAAEFVARTGELVPRSTENLYVGVAGDARNYASNFTYLTSILNRMDEGMDFHDAFKLVDSHQISYDPRNYTRFEKTYLKRILPFYSFLSRSFKQTAVELYTNPGGRLGGIIRAQRLAQGGQDQYVPYDLQDSAAIPLGESEGGDLKYITSLGLMHEGSLAYLMPTQGVRGILQQVIGSSNPLVKGIIEYGTNTSTFFDGPMGGRRLDDLDPAIGRILANVGITSVPPSGRPEPFLHPIVEAIAANSPAAAAIRIAKVATESPERRSVTEKLFNLGTGFRTKVVTPEALIRELRDRLNAEEIKLGARPITTVVGVKKIEEQLRASGDIEQANRLDMIQQALSILKKRMDERNKNTPK